MANPSDEPRTGAPAPVDAAELRRRVESSRQRIVAAEARAREARVALDGAVTAAASPDRSVTLVVSPGGTLVDLTFGPGAQRLPLPSLARTVLATYREATAEALAHTQAVLADLLGDAATPVVDAIRASVPELPDAGR